MNIPNKFHINVTNKCNLNCKQCYAARNEETMTADTLNKIAKHIYNLYKLSDFRHNTFGITISGGELGFFNTDLVCDFLDGLQVLMPDVYFDIECVSNLVYPLQDKHFRLFDKATRLSTSYDFGDVRFRNTEHKKLWFKNAKTLVEKYGRDNFEVYTCLTTEMMKIEPKALMDMFYMMPFKKYEIHELCRPIRPEQREGIKDITPTWDKVYDYLYEAFLRYIEYRPELELGLFECMIASCNGNNYYEHSRTCQEDYVTFYPNSISYGCAMCDDAPFDSIDIPTEQMVDSVNRTKVINLERRLPKKCYECKWLEQCKGGCYMMAWQGDMCHVPKEVYEYIVEHNIK